MSTLRCFSTSRKLLTQQNHEILIRKLKVYGIDGIELEWFRSYLSCRQQYCTLNGHKSSSLQFTCGIPQGTCLGPLLFILYLNDFEYCLNISRANLYADDTEVSFSSNELSDVARNFQAELKNISEWMRINKLSIHPEKTEFMVIDHPRRQSKLPELQPFYLDNIRITQVHKTKYLGLTVDDKLSWSEQHKSVKGKVAGGLRLHYVSPPNLRSLLLLLSLQLRDLCPFASIQGLIRPSPPCSRRVQSDHYFLNKVRPRANS